MRDARDPGQLGGERAARVARFVNDQVRLLPLQQRQQAGDAVPRHDVTEHPRDDRAQLPPRDLAALSVIAGEPDLEPLGQSEPDRRGRQPAA
jgi:hypothetical protein